MTAKELIKALLELPSESLDKEIFLSIMLSENDKIISTDIVGIIANVHQMDNFTPLLISTVWKDETS